MDSGEEGQVTRVVMDFLKTSNMEVTTERMVLKHVASALSLSQPLSEYRTLVSATIDKYLENLDPLEAVDEDEKGGGEDEVSAGASGKRRGKAAAGPSSKRSRGSDDILFSTNLSNHRKARVVDVQGKPHVDIREFYQGEAGEATTRKGLALDPGQWAQLALELPRLVEALRGRNAAGPTCHMSNTRRATVNEHNGTFFLNLREYFYKNGELFPTKIGVTLSLVDAEALLAAVQDITMAVGDRGELANATEEAEEAPTKGAAQRTAALRPSNSSVASVFPSAAPPPAPAPGGKPGSGGTGRDFQAMVPLGSRKRMYVNQFKGHWGVNLREFYEKCGEMLPGKKGIVLKPDDWSTLTAHFNDVDVALKHRDLKYVLNLTGQRRLSLSEFKGVLYVGVREYYDKGGGEMAPGAKGLNLTSAEWADLTSKAHVITAALEGV